MRQKFIIFLIFVLVFVSSCSYYQEQNKVTSINSTNDFNKSTKNNKQLNTPEETILFLEKELSNGNIDLYINRTYFSDEFVKTIAELACMTLDDFKQDFKSRARDSLPSDEIDFVNYTYKYISDENNVYLEYETHYVPSESGYVPLPRKDKSYLKKIDGLWYIDLQYEMDLLGPYLEYELGTEKPCLLNSNKKDEYITYNLSALHFCDLVSITEDLWHMNNRGLYNSGEIRKAMDNELATYRQKFESEVVSQLRLLDIKSLQVNHRGGEYWGGSCSIEADLTLPVQKEYDNQKINLSVYVPYRTGNLRLGKTDFIGVNSSELNAFIDKKFDFLTQNEHFRVLFYQHDVRNIALSMAGKQEGPVIYMPGSDYITIQGKWGNETDKLSDDYDLRYEFMNYYDTEGYLSSTWYVFYGSSSLLDNLSSAFSESAIAKAKANELIDSLNQEKNLDCNIDFYSFRASSKDEYIGVGSEWKVGFYIKGEDSCPCGIELSLVNKKDEGLVLFDHFFQYGGRQGCIML